MNSSTRRAEEILRGEDSTGPNLLTWYGYEGASSHTAVLEEDMTSVVQYLVDEVPRVFTPSTSEHLDYMGPFKVSKDEVQGGPPVVGMLWAGAPGLDSHGVSEGGALIFTWHNDELSKALRVMPGSEEGQLAFVPMRCNCLDDMIPGWGADDLRGSLKHLALNCRTDSLYPIDKLAAAVMALWAETGREGAAFRELLGGQPDIYIATLFRYLHKPGADCVLMGMSPSYRAATGMVLDYAFPLNRERPTLVDVRRALHEQGVTQRSSVEEVWPWYYNLVLPPRLFEATRQCVEAGYCPILPNYYTGSGFLFNGEGSNMCLGDGYNPGKGPWAKKMWAGTHAGFNLDILGNSSHCPFPLPPEWVDRLIQSMVNLQKTPPALSMESRMSEALEHAKIVPCVFYQQDHQEGVYNVYDSDDQPVVCNVDGTIVEVSPEPKPDPPKEDPDRRYPPSLTAPDHTVGTQCRRPCETDPGNSFVRYDPDGSTHAPRRLSSARITSLREEIAENMRGITRDEVQCVDPTTILPGAVPSAPMGTRFCKLCIRNIVGDEIKGCTGCAEVFCSLCIDGTDHRCVLCVHCSDWVTQSDSATCGCGATPLCGDCITKCCVPCVECGTSVPQSGTFSSECGDDPLCGGCYGRCQSGTLRTECSSCSYVHDLTPPTPF